MFRWLLFLFHSFGPREPNDWWHTPVQVHSLFRGPSWDISCFLPFQTNTEIVVFILTSEWLNVLCVFSEAESKKRTWIAIHLLRFEINKNNLTKKDDAAWTFHLSIWDAHEQPNFYSNVWKKLCTCTAIHWNPVLLQLVTSLNSPYVTTLDLHSITWWPQLADWCKAS